MIEIIIASAIGAFIGASFALALDRTYNELVFRRLKKEEDAIK